MMIQRYPSRLGSVFVLILLAFFLSGPVLRAASLSGTLETDPASGIDIKISNDFDTPATMGTLAMRVQIANRSSKNGSWAVMLAKRSYSSGGEQSRVDLQVEAGQTRNFSVLLPMSTYHEHGAQYRIDVNGPGITKGSLNFYAMAPGGRSNTAEPFAVSKELAMRSMMPLRTELEAKNWNCSSSVFDPHFLPDQWRGFSGYRWLFMSDREWAALDSGPRNAIRQWVGAGGRLSIATVNAATVSFGPFSRHGKRGEDGRLFYGLGEVSTIPWDGRELSPAALLPLLTKQSFSSPEAKGNWLPIKETGSLDVNAPLILGIVIGLAVVLGPVNLFVLAPAGRRHRLFVTTPLLSLGGSALLILGILFQDGKGGGGSQWTMIHLLPGVPEAVVFQDQVSKSGLLFSNKFRLDPETLITPISIRNSDQKRFNHRRDDQSYTYQNGIYSGDWFESRSVKAHHLSSIRSTRASIAVIACDPAGAPQVLSSFATPLEKLVIKDAKGKFWQGANLRTGERMTLKAATRKEWDDAWRTGMERAHESTLESTLQRFHKMQEEDGFFAVLADADAETIPTLSSIRWKSRVVASGPVEFPTVAQEGVAP